jgi:hypothetical protein
VDGAAVSDVLFNTCDSCGSGLEGKTRIESYHDDGRREIHCGDCAFKVVLDHIERTTREQQAARVVDDATARKPIDL